MSGSVDLLPGTESVVDVAYTLKNPGQSLECTPFVDSINLLPFASWPLVPCLTLEVDLASEESPSILASFATVGNLKGLGRSEFSTLPDRSLLQRIKYWCLRKMERNKPEV